MVKGNSLPVWFHRQGVENLILFVVFRYYDIMFYLNFGEKV